MIAMVELTGSFACRVSQEDHQGAMWGPVPRPAGLTGRSQTAARTRLTEHVGSISYLCRSVTWAGSELRAKLQQHTFHDFIFFFFFALLWLMLHVHPAGRRRSWNDGGEERVFPSVWIAGAYTAEHGQPQSR